VYTRTTRSQEEIKRTQLTIRLAFCSHVFLSFIHDKWWHLHSKRYLTCSIREGLLFVIWELRWSFFYGKNWDEVGSSRNSISDTPRFYGTKLKQTPRLQYTVITTVLPPIYLEQSRSECFTSFLKIHDWRLKLERLYEMIVDLVTCF
jgi:hypothetical protein